MGQQPIPGMKSGRQKKPVLALPSDTLSIFLGYLEGAILQNSNENSKVAGSTRHKWAQQVKSPEILIGWEFC